MSNYKRNLNRLRGFTDGAGGRGMLNEFDGDKDYERGYVDGQKAKKAYTIQSAKELGVELHAIVTYSES
jgi:hypothetical protein